MYDHIGLKVGNLDAAVRFYVAALAPLGYVLCSKDESGAGFGPKGEPALWLYLHKGLKSAGAHIAFRAPDHAAIKKFHSEGIKAGGIRFSIGFHRRGNVLIAKVQYRKTEALLLTGDAAATDPVCTLSPERNVVDAILTEVNRPAAVATPTKPEWLYRINP